jgi:lysophospholipase L1-like esterase
MRVLVFGASSAQGFWDSRGGWADRLKHYYDGLQMQDFSVEQPRLMNLGVSNDSTAEILKRLGPECKARQNDKGLAVVIQVGSNNAAEIGGRLRSSPEKYETDLETIIKKAEEFTYKILVVGFPAVDESKTNPIAWADIYYRNENISLFEKAAARICDKLEIPFVSLHEHFLNSKEKLHAHDGLHPNDDGHKLIFELVRPQLDELLQSL